MDIGRVNVLKTKHYPLLTDNYDVIVKRQSTTTGVSKAYHEEMIRDIDTSMELFKDTVRLLIDSLINQLDYCRSYRIRAIRPKKVDNSRAPSNDSRESRGRS